MYAESLVIYKALNKPSIYSLGPWYVNMYYGTTMERKSLVIQPNS